MAGKVEHRMDADTRKNIAARDEALAKTGRVTRRVGVAALGGSLLLMAGFAHVIPTHLPHLNLGGGSGNGGVSNGTGGSDGGSGGGTSNGTSNSGTSSGSGNVGNGSGPSQVTSGGS